MFNIITETIEWGGVNLSLETGKIARQADGAVLATYGATSVMATIVAEHQPKPGLDFFPLTVNYQEKTYAAGKIPGGFFKREGRPSERETLISRLIDRPIRPLFDSNFKNETQIIVTVLSHDMENDPDIVALVAVSAAIALSGVPFEGPIGAARVGYIDGDYVLNPRMAQYEASILDLVVAGTKDAVLMVESEAQELSEEVMLGAVMFGHKGFQPVIEMIAKFASQAAKPLREIEAKDNSALIEAIRAKAQDDMVAAFAEPDKQLRTAKLAEIRQAVTESLLDEAGDADAATALSSSLKKCEGEIVRNNILAGKPRIDGRALDAVRPIVSEVGILPRAHGSALFTRGETQALVVATLGTSDDEQLVDALEGKFRENFILHYNFPPFSVGETGRVGFTGRREVGHGKLAWRAVHPMLPTADVFPYTLRIVSEITESNGSSSMASVCGTSLALMDAGVPITKPVAGIAMGLIKEADNFAVLSDILGDEDHLGDMDFKVAGTQEGITALQMDIKITGITEEIMQVALTQAKAGRHHILAEMAKALDSARPEMGEYAPKIESIEIPVDKIRDVIGKGGTVIREISETTDTKINVADDGTIQIASSDAAAIAKAVEWIKTIVGEQNGEEIKIPRDRIRDVIGRGGAVVREITEKTNTRIDIADSGVVSISPMEPGNNEAVTKAIEWIRRLTVEQPTESITIPTEKIREIIGRGGSVIRGISDQTATRINVNDDGVVKVSGTTPEAIAAGIERVREIAFPDGNDDAPNSAPPAPSASTAEDAADMAEGTIYDGEVIRVMDYGIFVNFAENQVGLVHTSQLPEEWGNDTTANASVGDILRVQFIGMNDEGKPRLSMKFNS